MDTKKNHGFAVFGGKSYTEGSFKSFFIKKKDAITAILAEGYKYDKKQNLYLSHACVRWYRIDKRPLNTLNEPAAE